jgi:LPXTG-motif cell wall-anchored protein
MKRGIAYITVLPLLAFASLASALTCNEVILGTEITDRFPTAQDACLEVVEQDGRVLVKMRVELTRTPIGNRVTFRFKHADGSSGPTYSTTLSPSWRVRIGESQFRAQDLIRGQQLSIYLPADRWEAHIAASDVVVTTFTFIIINDAAPEPLMLPSTASNMPLFALFGGLALFGAGLIRVTRRQTSY